MNLKRQKKVRTRFAPETRFEVRPLPAAPFRAEQATQFERLLNRLLVEKLGEPSVGLITSQLRRAANDAAALAWTTSFPLLFFPVLFEEKARAAAIQQERQEQVLQRSRELLAA
jgi:hypothetical protein